MGRTKAGKKYATFGSEKDRRFIEKRGNRISGARGTVDVRAKLLRRGLAVREEARNYVSGRGRETFERPHTLAGWPRGRVKRAGEAVVGMS